MSHVNNAEAKHLSRDKNSTLLAYILTIVKLFVSFLIGGGLLFGIFQSVRIQSFHGFIEGLVFGASLAIFGLPFLILIDIIQKTKCYIRYGNIDFGVAQERRFVIEEDYMSLFNRFVDVLVNIKKIEVYRREIERGIIEANVRRTWRSFGEKIKVELFKSSKDTSTVVVLASKPKISLTMLDYCKNFENVETIMNEITKIER